MDGLVLLELQEFRKSQGTNNAWTLGYALSCGSSHVDTTEGCSGYVLWKRGVRLGSV